MEPPTIASLVEIVRQEPGINFYEILKTLQTDRQPLSIPEGETVVALLEQACSEHQLVHKPGKCYYIPTSQSTASNSSICTKTASSASCANSRLPLSNPLKNGCKPSMPSKQPNTTMSEPQTPESRNPTACPETLDKLIKIVTSQPGILFCEIWLKFVPDQNQPEKILLSKLNDLHVLLSHTCKTGKLLHHDNESYYVPNQPMSRYAFKKLAHRQLEIFLCTQKKETQHTFQDWLQTYSQYQQAHPEDV